MPSLLATMKERALLIRTIGYVLVWASIAENILFFSLAQKEWFLDALIGFEPLLSFVSNVFFLLFALGVVSIVASHLLRRVSPIQSSASVKEKKSTIRKIGYIVVCTCLAAQLLLGALMHWGGLQAMLGYGNPIFHYISAVLIGGIILGAIMIFASYLFRKADSFVDEFSRQGSGVAQSANLSAGSISGQALDSFDHRFSSLDRFRIVITITGFLVLIGSAFANYAGLQTALYAISGKGLWVGAALLFIGLMLMVRHYNNQEFEGQNQFGPRTRSRFSGGLVLTQIIFITTPVWVAMLFGETIGFALIGIIPLLFIAVSLPAIIGTAIVAFLPRSLSNLQRGLRWAGISLVLSGVATFIFRVYIWGKYL